MEIQLDILFIVVITYIVSALFTILIMKTSHRKEINGNSRIKLVYSGTG